MKVAVLQYETRHERALRLLMKYTRDYCEDHGYFYICPTDVYDIPTYWIKVRLVQQVFESVPADEELAVAWIDSDAVFVRPEVSVESILSKAGRDFVTSLDPGSTTDMNAGVFFIRRTEETRKLVNDWMSCYDPSRWSFNGEKWTTVGKWAGPDYEQGAFNAQIIPKYRQQIALLGEKVLACYEPYYENETIVCHFMYKHKWKIWVYNTNRNLSEVLLWLGIGIISLYFVKRR